MSYCHTDNDENFWEKESSHEIDAFILCESAVLFAPLRILSFLGTAAHTPWGPIEPPGGLVRDLSYQSLHPPWISKLWLWRIGKHSPPVFPSDSPSNNPFLLYSINPLTAQEIRYWCFANDGDFIFIGRYISKKGWRWENDIPVTVIKCYIFNDNDCKFVAAFCSDFPLV